MVRLVGFLVALALAFASPGARACAVCSNGSPALRADPSSSEGEATHFRLSLDTKIGRVRSGSAWLDDRRLELDFAVQPTRDVELSVAAPLLHRTVHERGLAPESALVAGDLELRGTFTLYRATGRVPQLFALTGGTKLPSAPNERDSLGRPLPSALQPGCNAITPTLGVAYALSSGVWGVSASASFLMPIAVRKAPHAAESVRTTFSVSLDPTRWLTARSGLATRYEPSGELYPGISDPRSGGFVGSLVEELAVRPIPSLTFGAAIYAPVLQALHGDQRVGPTLAADVAATF